MVRINKNSVVHVGYFVFQFLAYLLPGVQRIAKSFLAIALREIL